jgi:quercetin dioxygenase-like cupin family protein
MIANQPTGAAHAYWSEVEGSSASKMAFFDVNKTEPHIPTREAFDRVVLPESVRDKVDLFELHGSCLSLKVLLNQSGDNAFSLVQVTAAPHTVIQRHKHTSDQVVWCVAGSMTQGNKLLEAGSGYFTPANQPYGFEAGPDGVTYIEFRHCPLANTETIFVEENPARWGIVSGEATDGE